MFQLIIFFLLQTIVGAAPLGERAFAFVTLTKPPTYVTVGPPGANVFVTQTAGQVFYTTQWPTTETPAPAPPADSPAAEPPAPATPAAPDAPVEPVTSDYATVLVSSAAPPAQTSGVQLENTAQEKFPTASTVADVPVTTSQVPPQPSTTTDATTSVATTTSPGFTSTTELPATTTEPSTSTTPSATSTIALTTSTFAITTSSLIVVSSAAATSSPSGGSVPPPEYIVYSPYLDTQGCKDYATVLQDLQLIKSKGIMKLRTYGTDCNVMNTILPAAASLGMTISQGVWIGPDGIGAAVQDSVDQIISYGQQNGWSVFDNIVYGNEDVVNNYITVDQLLAAATSAKAQLRAAGFSAPFLHAEVTNIIQQNPELCGDVFDIVALNAHSYFDAYSTADQSGEFVKGQMGLVQATCGSKQVWISETGYPWKGQVNGGQVPSKENQIAALNSIHDVVGSNVVVLTTFNDMWKNPGPYGVEQYFGVIDILA